MAGQSCMTSWQAIQWEMVPSIDYKEHIVVRAV